MGSSSLPKPGVMSQEYQNWKENQPGCRKVFSQAPLTYLEDFTFPTYATYRQIICNLHRAMPFTTGLDKY